MPRPPLRRHVATLGLLALVASACSSGSGVTTEHADAEAPASTGSSETTESTEGAVPDEGTIEWQPVNESLETAILEVPVDYDDPDGATFELFLVRRLANDQDDKIGSLLINPGGPGAGGAEFAASADFVFDEALLDRFDIIGWDPRGAGYSTPAIDCIDDYDEYYAGTDITPDDEAERTEIIDEARDFAEQCAERNADILQHIGTNDSARDIDAIRQALGEDTISYFGFSYGSELGATWATMFPDSVRAAVLDGAADPTVGLVEGGIQQAAGFEQTLATYLGDCSDDSDCAFHNDGDAEGAFDELMLALDEDPIPSEPGRPDITRGVALQAVAAAMYDDSLWEQLSEALAAAQDGDGKGLLQLWDSYYRRQPDGTWPNFLEAFQVISCMDEAERPTVDEDDAMVEEYHEVAPRFAPNTTGSYFCTFFPPTEDPRIAITGAGAGPIVVIGTTGDPATPLASTRVMASTLEDGRLVTVTADKHTGYGENDCVDDAVHRYLIDLEPPPDETEC
jgi:pimeloyl-ACP methyl ester carboxylesterase